MSDETKPPTPEIQPIDTPDIKPMENARVISLDLSKQPDREFLENLKKLLKTDDLPFKSTCVQPGSKSKTLQLTIDTEGP